MHIRSKRTSILSSIRTRKKNTESNLLRSQLNSSVRCGLRISYGCRLSSEKPGDRLLTCSQGRMTEPRSLQFQTKRLNGYEEILWLCLRRRRTREVSIRVRVPSALGGTPKYLSVWNAIWVSISTRWVYAGGSSPPRRSRVITTTACVLCGDRWETPITCPGSDRDDGTHPLIIRGRIPKTFDG